MIRVPVRFRTTLGISLRNGAYDTHFVQRVPKERSTFADQLRSNLLRHCINDFTALAIKQVDVRKFPTAFFLLCALRFFVPFSLVTGVLSNCRFYILGSCK